MPIDYKNLTGWLAKKISNLSITDTATVLMLPLECTAHIIAVSSLGLDFLRHSY